VLPYAIVGALMVGGIGLGALGQYLLYKAGYWGGLAAEKQKITADTAAKMQRENDVLQKEVSNDDLQKSLKDGTF
jgi:TRAP-type C4-dicarboxylate transport system substrate-binding protein